MDPSRIASAFLKSHSLFGGIPEEAVERIKLFFECTEYAADAVIIAEGTPNPRVHFILSGRVEVSKKGLVLAAYGPGDTFGEMEFLDIMPSAATVRALEQVTTASFTGMALHAIYKSEPDSYSLLVMNLARDLSRRLRALQAQLESSRGA